MRDVREGDACRGAPEAHEVRARRRQDHLPEVRLVRETGVVHRETIKLNKNPTEKIPKIPQSFTPVAKI